MAVRSKNTPYMRALRWRTIDRNLAVGPSLVTILGRFTFMARVFVEEEKFDPQRRVVKAALGDRVTSDKTGEILAARLGLPNVRTTPGRLTNTT